MTAKKATRTPRRSTRRTCAHPTCGCGGAAGTAVAGFCSPYCSAAHHTDVEPGACACGHDECTRSQDAGPPHARRETRTSIGAR